MTVQEPEFLKLSEDDQKASIEVLIFAAESPISIKTLFNILIAGDFAYEENADVSGTDDASGNDKAEQITLEDEMKSKYDFTLNTIKELIDSINKDLIESGRPFEIVHYGGGYQFSTRREYGHLVQQFMKNKSRKRLSQAALEALAIIAYKQPVSKPEIEQIRGVNSNEIVNSLMDKGFVRIAGRSEALGKPLLYATTQEFLRAFGLSSLTELPKLRELDDIAESDISLPDTENEITFSITDDKDIENIDKSGISKIEIEKEIKFDNNGLN